ncbi:uncharacterized protein METZ01_LOCUS199186, partial [marine metagenome]
MQPSSRHDTTKETEASEANPIGSSTAQTDWKDPPSWLPPTFHALAYRNYVLLWLGQ